MQASHSRSLDQVGGRGLWVKEISGKLRDPMVF